MTKLEHLTQTLIAASRLTDGAEAAGVIVAFSGGADSAFLAEVAHRTLGEGSLAVTADSPSIPRKELAAAVELASRRGWRHRLVETEELSDERYAANPTNRCYFCKSALMDRLLAIRQATGQTIMLGTNTDDLSDWRPGQAAASELGALHPLVEAEFSKKEIRETSKQLGLPTFDKPAAACLASRFAYGVRVTAQGLRRIEQAEDFLQVRGYRQVRVRDFGDFARIEVAPDQVGELGADLQAVGVVKDQGFDAVEVDPAGYRQGSLNAVMLNGV